MLFRWGRPRKLHESHHPRRPVSVSVSVSCIIGELQTVCSNGYAGCLFILHHAHRISNQHDGVGAGRVQVWRLHSARHAAVVHLLGFWEPSHAPPVSVLICFSESKSMCGCLTAWSGGRERIMIVERPPPPSTVSPPPYSLPGMRPMSTPLRPPKLTKK